MALFKAAKNFTFVDDEDAVSQRSPIFHQEPPTLFELCLQYVIRHQHSLALSNLPAEVETALIRKATINHRLLSGSAPAPLKTPEQCVVDVIAVWEHGLCDVSGYKMQYTAELLRRLFGGRIVLHDPLFVQSLTPLRQLAWESSDPQVRIAFALSSGVQPSQVCVGATEVQPNQYRVCALDVMQAILVSRTNTFPTPNARITVIVTDMELYGECIGNSCAIMSAFMSQNLQWWSTNAIDIAMRAILQPRLKGFCADPTCPLGVIGSVCCEWCAC
jgi:hypothetical protein